MTGTKDFTLDLKQMDYALHQSPSSPLDIDSQMKDRLSFHKKTGPWTTGQKPSPSSSWPSRDLSSISPDSEVAGPKEPDSCGLSSLLKNMLVVCLNCNELVNLFLFCRTMMRCLSVSLVSSSKKHCL